MFHPCIFLDERFILFLLGQPGASVHSSDSLLPRQSEFACGQITSVHTSSYFEWWGGNSEPSLPCSPSQAVLWGTDIDKNIGVYILRETESITILFQTGWISGRVWQSKLRLKGPNIYFEKLFCIKVVSDGWWWLVLDKLIRPPPEYKAFKHYISRIYTKLGNIPLSFIV